MQVTLPANMPGDSEFTLFDIYGKKTKAEDGGFAVVAVMLLKKNADAKKKAQSAVEENN